MSWMVRAISSLRKRYGNIHLRFGEPLSLAKELDPDLTGDARYLDIQKVAFEVCVRINRVTPITPTSVATVALLADPDRAQSSTELRTRLTELGDEIDRRQLPRTAPLDHLRTDHGIYEVMSGLAEHGIVEIIEGGPETVYRVREDNHIGAAYYRNTIIHFFVTDSLVELALVAGCGGVGGH